MNSIVIGGGLFGMYIAKRLLLEKHQVILIEQSNKMFNEASRVNQARLHLGFHYPRSPETARLCKSGYDSFVSEFANTVNSSFKQIYMVSNNKSKTSFDIFIDFCKQQNLKYSRIRLSSKLVNNQHIEGSIVTQETSFDYSMLGQQLLRDLKQLGCNILLNHKFISGDLDKKEILINHNNTIITLGFDYLVNCTYSNINFINEKLGIEKVPLKYELCELIKVKVPPKFRNYGFTLMDGDFMSIMPYGLSDYHTIWHVKHSVHEESSDYFRDFNVQRIDQENDTFSFVSNSQNSKTLINSSYKLIISDSKKIFPWIEKVTFIESMFVIKTVLDNVEDTDSRPSIVIDYPNNPNYFVIFSGKIDTLRYTSDTLVAKINKFNSNE
jgi:hypothetical protein